MIVVCIVIVVWILLGLVFMLICVGTAIPVDEDGNVVKKDYDE